jgi:site-specific recombinase XerD
MTHPLASYIKRFLSHYLPVQRGLSVNSVCAYRDTIKLLIRYTSDTLGKPADELLVEDIGEAMVLGFLDHLEQVRGCTARTRNARLAAIRSLSVFIGREEPILLDWCRQIRSIPLKRTEHKTALYLEDDQMNAVLDAVDLGSRTGLRDRALLLLLYNTGARVSEIVTLRLDDLRLDHSPQIRLFGKGGKIRSAPLWPETVTALGDYLNQRHPKGSNTIQATPTALPLLDLEYAILPLNMAVWQMPGSRP